MCLAAKYNISWTIFQVINFGVGDPGTVTNAQSSGGTFH